ncbi:prolipoprotein diacylglyceryl transferase [Candidatus Woesearchaeota archaeon]|nr:prolipoprotein diacylglyceryl transferase [Candidatus Woesearchaeota archaeon]
MFYNSINPVLAQFGPFEIRYYGIIYALGFLLAYFMIPKLAQLRKIQLTKEDTSGLLIYLILGTVIGARVFYILFYNLDYYLGNPADMLALWHGGLSFHGGFIGAAFASWLFCRKTKIHFYDLADITVIPLALGLFLGRIGNFLNGELVGRPTNLPWCVKFKDYEGCRHPSQLYESMKNLLIFSVLWGVRKKPFPRGTLFWLFAIMYSTLRFFIEFFRMPDEQLGFIFGLTMGQWLNIAMLAVGIFFLARIFQGKPSVGETIN